MDVNYCMEYKGHRNTDRTHTGNINTDQIAALSNEQVCHRLSLSFVDCERIKITGKQGKFNVFMRRQGRAVHVGTYTNNLSPYPKGLHFQKGI